MGRPRPRGSEEPRVCRGRTRPLPLGPEGITLPTLGLGALASRTAREPPLLSVTMAHAVRPGNPPASAFFVTPAGKERPRLQVGPWCSAGIPCSFLKRPCLLSLTHPGNSGSAWCRKLVLAHQEVITERLVLQVRIRGPAGRCNPVFSLEPHSSQKSVWRFSFC